MLRIQSLSGPNEGQVFEFQKSSILLGRSSECDVLLDDSACSRRHACIQLLQDRYVITDLQSTNGVKVNGEAREEATLQCGDSFKLGNVLFKFLSESPFAKLEPTLDIRNTSTLQEAEDWLFQLDQQSFETAKGNELELERLQKANRAIYFLSRATNSKMALRDLYQLIIDNTFSAVKGAEKVCVFVVDKDTGQFVRVKSQAKEGGDDFQVSRAVLSRVKSDRAGVLASDALADTRFEGSQTLVTQRVRSLICVPLTNAENVLGAIYVENSSLPDCFEETDLELLTVFGNQVAMAIETAWLYKELEVSFYETIRSLCKALEAKDEYTRGHSARVARYAVGIGRELGLSEKQLEYLRIASELHDIGKIAIHEGIINSNRMLTDEEYELMQEHPKYGVEILKPIHFIGPILPIVLYHHERYDGRGYPDGLKGEEIPLEARILNLADAFDAMTTQRAYNKPKTFEEAKEQCTKEAGISFDSQCVMALYKFLKREGLLEEASRTEAGDSAAEKETDKEEAVVT